MKLEGEQVLLRVHLRNTDQSGWRNAADVLVERARHEDMAGATLLRGIYGLDLNGCLLESGRWSLVEHVPIVVEIVDSRPNIARFLGHVIEIISEGIITLERAHVMLYRSGAAAAAEARAHLEIPEPIPALSTVPSEEDFAMIKMSEAGQLVRVFIGESDTWHGEPLYRAIVTKAHELGLAGATVLHGTMGFGANTRVHTSRLLDLSTDLPIVVEVVDSAEKIAMLLPFLDETVAEGMITVEGVRVLKYRRGEATKAESSKQ
jgi:PII-like signaling protein